MYTPPALGPPALGPPAPAPPVTAAGARQYRQVLGHFATGVTVVTALEPGRGRPLGMTVNSFTSVSLEPPLVLFCVQECSSTWPTMRAAGRLAVNILGYADRSVSTQMAAPGERDRFRNVAWAPSPAGAPVIPGAVAWLDGEVYAEHACGDHRIVIVEVRHFDAPSDAPPLVFLRGRYGWFAG